MAERMQYHFEPNKGWMNDPNGLVYFKGKYHVFFQHNPYSNKWDKMHWGHAVSDDLIHWEELDIALYPDMDYENDGGCFSGSAIVKDDVLYLFYTSVSKEMGQTQSLAISEDGINFHKHEMNPLIKHFPMDGSSDFRDPKVFKYKNEYRMIVGTCTYNNDKSEYEDELFVNNEEMDSSKKSGNKIGRIVSYKSNDLINWEYIGILYESNDYFDVIECPDLFEIDDKWVLMYSRIGLNSNHTQFVIGNYDGQSFIPEQFGTPEYGPQFYAPQTFGAPDERRILIGWFYDWIMKCPDEQIYAGAFTIPREIGIKDNQIIMNPVREAYECGIVDLQDNKIEQSNNRIVIHGTSCGDIIYEGTVENLQLIRDADGLEIFINGGKTSFSCRNV